MDGAEAESTLEDEALEWRCVRTKPKSEHLAARHLKRLDAVEAYCPLIRFKKSTRRGPVWFQEALFPGYLFVRFDLGTSLRAVNATQYVTGIVRFGEEYPVVPDHVIEQLRAEFDPEEPVTVFQTLEVGDEVEVAEGPLRGTVAYVTSLPDGSERVRILLQFLGEEREVEVPLFSLLGFRNARHFAGPSTPEP